MDPLQSTLALFPEQLRKRTDPSTLGFATTKDLPDLHNIGGQQRAQEAITFALQMPSDRYNLFVSGQPGSGRLTAALAAVAEASAHHPAGPDWCYIYHFERPSEPLAVALPCGSGVAFAHDMDLFVESCRRELRRAFGSEGYRQQRRDLLSRLSAKRAQLLDELEQAALAHGFALQATSVGLTLLPLKHHEEAAAGAHGSWILGRRSPAHHVELLSPEEFSLLPIDEQHRIEAEHAQIQQTFEHVMPQLRELDEEGRNSLLALENQIAQSVVSQMGTSLAQRYTENAVLASFLQYAQHDMILHADVLAAAASDGQPEQLVNQVGRQEDDNVDGETSSDGQSDEFGADFWTDGDLRQRPDISALLRRYRINVFIAGPADGHAPIVHEITPSYASLIGRIEFGLREGLPYTDHLLMKPGALHRANGGYLIVQASDLLRDIRSWEAVKRVLRFGVITMNEMSGEAQSLLVSASLRPEPIPAQLKVILIGDPETYTGLSLLDPEFSELFSVRADFDTEMPRAGEGEACYSQFSGQIARKAAQPPLTAEAVAVLIEEGSRWAEDQEYLSARLRAIQDLVMEACTLAMRENAATVSRSHVEAAILARERRMSLIPEKLDNLMAQGTIVIDTSGAVVGQVNGLTVLSAAEFTFGKPARITARTSPGRAGILNLERETLMSGPAHSKGILILTGYLAGRYAQEFPLSLMGSICFEQIYGEIEGDSASSAELYALLSSLAELPLDQGLAVTGSVNQHGEVQAVGKVTEKIEGFFTLCQARGLSGKQGVIIPRANVRHLMLREPVVDAVRRGQFHIFAISHIDEGIELLTGVPAGTADQTGGFPDGTVNGRVSRALRAFADRLHGLA